MKPVSVLGILVLCVASVQVMASEAWTEDFDAATSQAEKEKKDLLMDFTGSDWCGWCIKLKKEVLGQAPFIEAAQKNFVLVELDYPRGKKQPAKIKDQNKLLQKAFKIEGYPTIFLADSQGRGYAKTGYQQGGVEPYLSHLAELRQIKVKRDEFFAKAEKATGIEKAKLLDQALSVVPEDARVGYDEVLKQIAELDPENKSGLKEKYESQRLLDGLKAELEKGDEVASMEHINKFITLPAATPVMKQQALFWKAQLLNSKGDKPGVLEALEAAQKMDPNSEIGKQIPQILEQIKKAAAGGK